MHRAETKNHKEAVIISCCFFIECLHLAAGDPRAALLQPARHPRCTPALLAAGDLPHAAGVAADRPAL